MPVPLLNFQPYNPMDNLIKTAMGMYSGLGQAKGQQLTNQMNQERLPYLQKGLEEELLQAQLANQKSLAQQHTWAPAAEAELENLRMQPEIERSKIQSRDARIEDMKKGPTITTGISGMIAARDQARSQGREADANLIEQEIALTLKQKSASNFRSAPPDIKRSMVAQATAYTGDQSKGLALLQEGKTLEEIAQMYGITPEEAENMPGVYPPTQPNITAAINRDVASTELEYLQPLVNEGMGEYINQIPINGFSVEQAYDLAKGLNEDKQVKFMAAQMIMPEIIVLRLRQVGAEMSHAQYAELEEKTIGIKKAFEYGMTPEIYKKANNLANEWLAGAAKVANKKMFSTGRPKKSKEDEMVDSVSGAMNQNVPLTDLSDEEFEKQYKSVIGDQ